MESLGVPRFSTLEWTRMHFSSSLAWILIVFAWWWWKLSHIPLCFLLFEVESMSLRLFLCIFMMGLWFGWRAISFSYSFAAIFSYLLWFSWIGWWKWSSWWVLEWKKLELVYGCLSFEPFLLAFRFWCLETYFELDFVLDDGGWTVMKRELGISFYFH